MSIDFATLRLDFGPFMPEVAEYSDRTHGRHASVTLFCIALRTSRQIL
jgi:hypothetical protein